MGRTFADKYSLLHFGSGVIAQFLGLSWQTWAVLHLGFELGENTPWGMRFINTLPFWPGGKDYADAWINILGDNVFAILGYWFAFLLFR